MKQLTALLLGLMFGVSILSQHAWGQEHYSWQNGERITLEVKTGYYVARVADSVYARTAPIFDSWQIPNDNRYVQNDTHIIWLKNIDQNQRREIVDEGGSSIYTSPVFLLDNEGMKHTNGELLIRWKQNVSPYEQSAFEERFQLNRIEGARSEYIGETMLYEYLPPYQTTSLEIANELQESGAVEWASPNFSYAVKRFGFNGGPDDPYYDQQWNIPQIDGDMMWYISKGSDTVVAVFDDGVDLLHDDIADNLYRDGSGNVIGYNATNRGATNDPHPDGNDAHGTAVAGIIAAVTNNNEGVAGLAPSARIMPLQMGYTHPVHGQPYIETQPDWWVSSMNFATNNGAHAVNMSVGLGSDTDFNDAMDNAMNNGVVLVAASGNSGSSSIAYPASYSGVLATGASLQDDTRWSNSQYGSGLDLVAPGGAPIIWTTDRPGSIGYTTNSYFQFSGTSAAAPHSAAIAGVMKHVNPSLTPTQIRTILQNTADWKSHMNSNEYGHGRLNAYSAVKQAMPKSNNHEFTSSQTVSDALFISGNSTIASGATVTIAEGSALIIEGSVNTSGSRSTISVEGLLDVEGMATLSNIQLDVRPGGKAIIRNGANLNTEGGQVVVASDGHLMTHSNATFDMNRSRLLVNGTATIGSGFSMKRGGLVVNEDATLNMYGADIEVHKGGMDGLVGYGPGSVILRGEAFISGAHFHLEDGSGTWGGVQVTGPDATGSSLANVLVEHAGFGISLNNGHVIAARN